MSKESINSVTGVPGATVDTMNSFAGKRALITGASSGLGLEFADLLAAQKVNLVLVARRQEPMEKLASDLRRKYGVDVLVEAIDLASSGAAGRLKSSLDEHLSALWATLQWVAENAPDRLQSTPQIFQDLAGQPALAFADFVRTHAQDFSQTASHQR